jgi:hypothetical protein
VSGQKINVAQEHSIYRAGVWKMIEVGYLLSLGEAGDWPNQSLISQRNILQPLLASYSQVRPKSRPNPVSEFLASLNLVTIYEVIALR